MIRRIRNFFRRRWLARANAAMEQCQYGKATSLYLKALGGSDVQVEYFAAFGAINASLQCGHVEVAQEVLPRLQSLVDFLLEHSAFPDADAAAEVESALHRMRSTLLRHLRRFEESLEEANRAVRRHPSYDNRYQRATMLKHAGRLPEAIAEYDELVREKGEGYVRQALVGYLYLAGDTDRAEAMHAAMLAEDKVTDVANEAWIAACRGDREGCLRLMREAFQHHSSDYLTGFFGMDVEFDQFRWDPEFLAIARGEVG